LSGLEQAIVGLAVVMRSLSAVPADSGIGDSPYLPLGLPQTAARVERTATRFVSLEVEQMEQDFHPERHQHCLSSPVASG
jgi:hypothetical protein